MICYHRNAIVPYSVILVGGLLANACRGEGHRGASVTIESPGLMTSTDARLLPVKGRVAAKGWPVAAVRPIGNGVYPWYVQPRAELSADGDFECIVHLGVADSEPGAFEVCLFLTSSSESAVKEYPVGRRLSAIPNLPRSDTVIVLRGVTEDWLRNYRVPFSGFNWVVKSGVHGPGPNRWSEQNVRLDERGALLLSLVKRDDDWTCAEVHIDEPLGYGEYRWTISGQFSEYAPNVVVGLFLYEDQRHEIDFELSKWSAQSRSNAQFVVQPSSGSRMRRFDTGDSSRITVSIIWHEGLVRFKCWNANIQAEELLAAWRYKGTDIPMKGQLRPHINFWVVGGSPQSASQSLELTVERFQHHALP